MCPVRHAVLQHCLSCEAAESRSTDGVNGGRCTFIGNGEFHWSMLCKSLPLIRSGQLLSW